MYTSANGSLPPRVACNSSASWTSCKTSLGFPATCQIRPTTDLGAASQRTEDPRLASRGLVRSPAGSHTEDTGDEDAAGELPARSDGAASGRSNSDAELCCSSISDASASAMSDDQKATHSAAQERRKPSPMRLLQLLPMLLLRWAPWPARLANWRPRSANGKNTAACSEDAKPLAPMGECSRNGSCQEKGKRTSLFTSSDCCASTNLPSKGRMAGNLARGECNLSGNVQLKGTCASLFRSIDHPSN
mmetsp:Transcript_11387/g.36131  ORF Transcript_11387/g.36131 Transcript_11387/m.36131 type:complete len:247 (-) Transcript_11387:1972-2712(-)